MFRFSVISRKYLLCYGLALVLFVPLVRGHAQANETVLYAFKDWKRGAKPYAGLIADGTGDFYGTTYAGGSGSCDAPGCGTVFKLAPDGTETVLYSFKSGNDGAGPYAGLIADAAGNLYGTTVFGGSGSEGTVFKLAPDGTESVLHSFTGGSDGAYPLASLIADSSGDLYGTTGLGGGGGCNGGSCGIVFKLAPDGTETVLYTFKGGSDGANPYTGGLIADSSGNLYGTTEFGGSSLKSCRPTGGCGTVFKLAPDGTETVLYAFPGGSDGAYPLGSLIADSSGNLYGTTSGGGMPSCEGITIGCGTVFKLAPDGTETVLYSFCSLGKCRDGSQPAAGLIADSVGDLFGTTLAGGAKFCKGIWPTRCGTVFELAPDGAETVLHSFEGGSDGANPYAGLIADSSGNLYGTTLIGGGSGCHHRHCGIVFKITK